MLDKDLENNGIYGYSKSKDKKRIDTILDSSSNYGGGGSLQGFVPDGRLADVGQSVDRAENVANALADKGQRSAYHFNAARESIVPVDSEQRRRRQFVLSQNVAEDAVNDFYKNSVKPEFERQRGAAEKEAADAYRGTFSVPGADPMAALGAARNASDPAKVIGRTMERLDNKQLNSIAGAYARYGGLNPESYRENVLAPTLRGRMENDYINRSVPGGSLEYVARSAYNNSLTGKLGNLALDGYSGGDSWRKVDDESMHRYNAGKGEEFASGVGALLVDSGIFAGLGAASSKVVGKATSEITKNLTSRVLANGASRGITGETARRIVDRTFVNTLGTRIATSGASQGLTLGAYDATNSVVDDILYGNGIDAGKAAAGFAKGMGTGVMLGAVGTPLKLKSQGLTGGKKVAASAGVLSAESAVFTLGTEVDKLSNGIEVEPIDLLADFGESTATLLAMRMAHWRPKGYLDKLNRDGRLKPELDFNSMERQEMRQAGVNPDNFISSVEQVLKPSYPSLHGNARRDFISNYEGLMSSDALSASTRAKLLYIVENKLTSTPPVPVDFTIQENEAGVQVGVKDNAGRNIERLSFASRSEADAFVERNSGVLRRNRIATIEETFRQGVDSENFFRRAGEYARETGVDIDVISNAMYKKAKRQPLNSREMQLIDDILYRANYNDVELGNVMFDIRSNVEQRYGLGRGALLAAVNKNTGECSVAENRALNDYENIIRQQAERMRSGVTDEMHAEARALIEKNGFDGYGNQNFRDYESGYNASVARRPERGNVDFKSSYKYFYPEEYERARETGFPYPADGELSISRDDARNPAPTYLHSHDQLARMTAKANETARKLNTNVELLYDPHELNPEEEYYSQKLAAKGWHDSTSDKITINLASNDNVEDAGFSVLHEYVGHKGLANLFGDNYVGFLDEMLARATPEVLNKVKQCRYIYGLRNDYEAMDEYLALAAEKTDKTPAERRLLERLKDFVNDGLYRMRIPNVRDLDDRKIAMLMSQHRKALENSTPAAKHRSGVFGSFRASHMDYGTPNGEGMNGGFRRFQSDNGEPLLRTNKYRFIGEKGFANLVENGYKNIDGNSLAVARDYDKRGIKDRILKRRTGWERGADGKWRYELNDNDVSLDFYPEKRMRDEHPRIYNIYKNRNSEKYIEKVGKKKIAEAVAEYERLWDEYSKETPKLHEVIDDEMFFDAYPEYRETYVVYKDLPNDFCTYNPRHDVLYVDSKSLGTRGFNKAVAAEMQKMIQLSEGFSRAYPIEDFIPQDVYNKINAPFDDADVLKNLGRIFPHDWRGNFARREDYYKRYGFYPNSLPVDETAKDDWRLRVLNMRNGAQSGNVELRNVKERFGMSDKARRNSMAYDTEDVERSSQYSPKSAEEFDKMLAPIDLINMYDLWHRKENKTPVERMMEKRNPDDLLN